MGVMRNATHPKPRTPKEDRMEAKNGQSGQDKVFQIVTDQVMEMLEAGTVPWTQPWKGGMVPTSYQTKKAYRGMNVWMLNATAQACGYSSNWWITKAQVRKAGAWIRKEEFKKSTYVIFCKVKTFKVDTDETDDQGNVIQEERARFTYWYHEVWNLDQVDGIEAPDAGQEPKEANQTMEEAQAIVDAFLAAGGPSLDHGGARAFYRPTTDAVKVPTLDSFQDSENYYHVLFHELAHATGHSSRLGREGVTNPTMFGSHEYSKEELVAEMGAAFLGAMVGLTPRTIDNTAAYIDSWLRVLDNDRRMVVYAASKAQGAAEHILGVTWDK